MPTYEYACAACGVVEAFQSMRDAPLTVCPNCQENPVQRLISRGAGVIFKGGGFWETDYNRSSDYQGKAKSEGGAPAATPAPAPAATPAPASPSPPPKPA